MRKRKIGLRTLTAREPRVSSIKPVRLNVFHINIKAFVKDFMAGTMTVELEERFDGSDLGFINICSYFFGYALRMIVEHSSLTEATNLQISNTDDELTIKVQHHSIIPSDIVEKIRAAALTAGFRIEEGEEEVVFKTSFIKMPDSLPIYARTPDDVYFDLMNIFFWGDDVEVLEMTYSWK